MLKILIAKRKDNTQAMLMSKNIVKHYNELEDHKNNRLLRQFTGQKNTHYP